MPLSDADSSNSPPEEPVEEEVEAMEMTED